MYTPLTPLTVIINLLAIVSALPTSTRTITTRQAPALSACFLPGSFPLPAEVLTAATSLQKSITCSPKLTTIATVPDVSSNNVSFSSIDFSKSDQTPLEFALSEFSTADPLASTDLQQFKDSLDVYVATEAGLRSLGASLAIKVPKFFLEMQVSRIETAQGNAPTEAGLQVEHLRDKVTKNAAGKDQKLLDQVVALAAQLS